MFRHNLLIIYRNFKRFKSTFFINLIGLSSGLACALLIWLWVTDELNMDKFFQHDERLFHVNANHRMSNEIKTVGATPAMLAETMAEELPEVEYATAVVPAEHIPEMTISLGETNVKARGQFVGKDFFSVLSYPLLQGNSKSVLADKSSIVISETLARKLFKTTDNVIGKMIEWQHEKPYTVSGIFKDVPANASTRFDYLLHFDVYKEMVNIHWDNHTNATFLLLREGTNVPSFNKKIAGYLKAKEPSSLVTLFLRKYSDEYLHTYKHGVPDGGRIGYVRLLSIIAVFILLIACINFMNLSTAKASRRIREVGIKKAVGASQRALIIQYLGESMLMAFLSLLAAVLIVVLFLPVFNNITDKALSLRFDMNMILSFAGITFFTGLLAGSYPALYLSGFNPVTVLKGQFNSSVGELWARRGLVVVQFSLSVILIVSVIVVYKQIEYTQTKNLGYDRENVLYFQAEGQIKGDDPSFLAALRNIPGVVNASAVGGSMINEYGTTIGVEWKGKPETETFRFAQQPIGAGAIETLGLKMKEGRSFSQAFPGDSTAVILNEAAAKLIGFSEPVGQQITFWGENKTVAGVVKNFHFKSLHEAVEPWIYRYSPADCKEIVVRIGKGKEKETLGRLRAFYEQYNPGFAFDAKFLDIDYQKQYVAEQRVATLSRYFAGLAILISCLGLLGLAAFTAERRLKEIGIRKVLGSSNMGIVYLLSRDFTKLVFIAVLIALPLSYFIANRWLEGFAYSIDLKLWYFAGAGLLAMLTAWITVGSQAVKASRINPTRCLKD